jgi:penicillin amidase
MKRSVSILNSWKGTNNTGVAPTIYNKLIYMYLKNTYKDELGEEGFTQFLATHIMKQLIATQIVNEVAMVG